jgi:dienelactone hydrolase
MRAHLFLPIKVAPPFQAVVWFPGAGAMGAEKFGAERIENGEDFLPKSGRVLVLPIYKSTFERRDEYKPGMYITEPAKYRDHVLMWSEDVGRTLDYLETRPDTDAGRIAFFGFSWGANLGPMLLGVEGRFKAAIFQSGGLWTVRSLRQVEAVNFLPRVKIPLLLLGERYDASHSVELQQGPYLRLLGTPEKDKRRVIHDSGHAGMPHSQVGETLDWLDNCLGPVKR